MLCIASYSIPKVYAGVSLVPIVLKLPVDPLSGDIQSFKGLYLLFRSSIGYNSATRGGVAALMTLVSEVEVPSVLEQDLVL